MTRRALALVALVGCAAVDGPSPAIPRPAATAPAAEDEEGPASTPEPGSDAAAAAGSETAPVTLGPEPAPLPSAPGSAGEVWLRGSTHVHARPSGDSSEPIPDVIRWYESHGYDFIVLTDHNKVSEVGSGASTAGQPFVRDPDNGLIVLAGSELTHNPSGCLPPGDASKKCRIHVNALGATARPTGKIDWTPPIRKTHDRVAKYQAALDEAHQLGATLVQINHPQWFWGMTPEVLAELGTRGVRLVEIANAQFAKWNAGDATHPSTEQLWDAVLTAGVTMYGVASDDAHDYHGHGKWPPGGGWIAVHARRDPRAILDAIAAGRFYASTGVRLARAEAEAGELVVELAADEAAPATIAWIENGQVVETVHARTAHRALPASGYVRAVVTRDDGAKAWVQPVRR